MSSPCPEPRGVTPGPVLALASLVDFVDLGVFLLDPQRRIIVWNDWLAQHSGLPAATILGLNLFDAFPELRGTRLDQVVSAALQSGQSAVLSRQLNRRLLPLHLPDGNPVVQSAVVRPLPHHGSPHCLIQIRDESAAAHRERLMRDNQRALRRARVDAEQASAAKSDFLANISHEIRTPMNGVLGMARLLMAGQLDGKQRGYAEAIRDSGDRLLEIINDLLDISKLEAGRVELDSVEFDLESLVDDVMTLNAATALNKDLRLGALVHPPARCRFRGDPAKLRQVLANLVGNAVKFTETGRIEIECTVADDGTASDAGGMTVLRIEVRDTGIGIPDAVRPHLFRKFIQADSSITRRFGGTGLGLAISRQLVEMMGGTIGVAGGPVGSLFWFTVELQRIGPIDTSVPALTGKTVLICDDDAFDRAIYRTRLEAWGMTVATAEDAAAADVVLARAEDTDAASLRQRFGTPVLRTAAMASAGSDGVLVRPVKSGALRDALVAVLGGAAPNAAPARKAPRRHRHILLVEDNEINRQVARTLLEDAGHHVDEAHHGAAAVERAGGTLYDIILMDIQMPVMGGLEATGAIRALPGPNGRVPIVAMTANAMRGARETYLANGMDGYIAKPIAHDALLTLIDTLSAVPPSIAAVVAPDMPPLDIEQFENLRTLLADGTFPKLVRAFLEAAAERLRCLEEIGATGDLTALRQNAHDLISMAGNFGACRVEQLARKLEAACVTGDREAATGILACLPGQTEEALRLISARLDAPHAAAPY